jgi:hypothetical protein
MNRRQFARTAAIGAGVALVAPGVALAAGRRPSTYYLRGQQMGRALHTMAAGLAATLDASLRLTDAPVAALDPLFVTDRESGVRMRVMTDSRLFRWHEATFFLTDRELFEGPTDAASYRESVRALVYRAQHLGVTRLYPTECVIDEPGPLAGGPWKVEARYGDAIARASVERAHLCHRWSLSWMGA